MPIYEYACRACGHQFETMQKISEEPLVDCPNCNKPELKKLVSRAAFRLKGSGWYETDFKSGGKKNVAGESSSDSKSGTDSAGSDSGSSGDAPSGGSDKKSSDTKKSASAD